MRETRQIGGGDDRQGRTDRTSRNIVLIGMPGSGKSTLGRRVAKELGMEFLDTDVLIEEYERRPITEIFKTDGEGYFRRLESSVIETVLRIVTSPASEAASSAPGAVQPAPAAASVSLSSRRGLMLSVGGGAAENPDNAALLREIGKVVFIARPLEALERNIAYNGNRPLLSDRDKLVDQYERRSPLYAGTADRVVRNDGDFDDVAYELARTARLMGAESDYLVIGDPLAHTLSPRLHGALFEELRKQGYGEAANASYGAVRVTPEQLEASVRDIRAGFVKGFNVTIPHKQTIVPFLDELRGDAALAGAVNTVVRDARGVPAEGDNLIGYNTDMEGLKLALEARGRSYAGANVTVCGTGGAAAGVVCKAALEGAAKIVMIGRKEDAAARIREAAISAVPAPASPGTEGASAPRVDFVRHDFSEGAESPELDEALAGTDIFINATPLGMDGTSHRFASFCFIEKLSKGAFVYDLVYKPRETALVRAARERGLGAEGGLSMLVCQAMLSDELFLGVKADSPALYEAVRDKVV